MAAGLRSVFIEEGVWQDMSQEKLVNVGEAISACEEIKPGVL